MSSVHDSRTRTIVAEATPPGRGGVSIVRLSGSDSLRIGESLCHLRGQVSFSQAESRRLYNTDLVVDDQVLDSGLVSLFRAPRSLTGEDVVELHLHGNPAIVAQVVDASIKLGARLADPGEFMRRAFVAGKVDLTQVDALAALLAAREESLLVTSSRQLGGALRSHIESLRGALLSLVAKLELGLDFAEEGYEFTDRRETERLLLELFSLIQTLLRSHESLLLASHVPSVLLLGRPNAGKSTLFNAILGYDRSITHHAAGTTRDYVGETVSVRGREIRFLDTAGLRSEGDEIESIGVESARQLVDSVDLVLWMIDAADRSSHRASIAEARSLLQPGSRVILVNSRSDLASDRLFDPAEFPVPVLSSHALSVTKTRSVSELLDAIFSSLDRDSAGSRRGIEFIVTERQASLLRVIETHLVESFPGIATVPADGDLFGEEFDTLLLSSDVRHLLPLLDELIGFSTNEEVLDRIFGEFCIGK